MSEPRKKLIAQIHIAKNQLGLDDETYRSALKNATGKTSCSSMTFTDLHKALESMKKQGFKPIRKISPRSTGSRVDKMRAIWIEMSNSGLIDDGSENALLSWVKHELAKRNKPTIEALNWLENNGELNSLVEQLKAWDWRVRTKALNDDLLKVSEVLVHFEANFFSINQADATQLLLDHGCIAWHELFLQAGLKPNKDYIKDRRALLPLSEITEASTCA